MKGTGKITTTILLIAIFIIGVVILFVRPESAGAYISLVTIVLVPMLLVMCGIVGQSIVKVIKGNCDTNDVPKP
jgi:hypothetical protein